MKFRKKPVVVEAVRFRNETDLPPVQQFTGNALFHMTHVDDRGDDPDIVAEVWDRLHSTWVGVKEGQWIIKGVRGEFYPCDDSVFRETYEPIDTDPPAETGIPGSAHNDQPKPSGGE